MLEIELETELKSEVNDVDTEVEIDTGLEKTELEPTKLEKIKLETTELLETGMTVDIAAETIFLNMLRRFDPPQICHWSPVQSMLQSDEFTNTEPAQMVEP